MFLKMPSFSFYLQCNNSRSSFTKNLGIFLILIFFSVKMRKMYLSKNLYYYILLSTERRRNLVWDGECIFLIFFQRSILFSQWAKTWRKIPFWQKHLSQKAKINVFFCFLGRHFGCRPLDPTLDIWSNFVKKEKKHFTSFVSFTSFF